MFAGAAEGKKVSCAGRRMEVILQQGVNDLDG
jgi:hypothetical protein